MSSTVLGSAVTTATSAAVLLFCQIPLFNKVGAIVVCNSVSSVIVSLTLLPALMLVYGPKDGAPCKCTAWVKARFDRARDHELSERVSAAPVISSQYEVVEMDAMTPRGLDQPSPRRDNDDDDDDDDISPKAVLDSPESKDDDREHACLI